MFFILDPNPRKFEIKRRNDKINWFVACHIVGGLSKVICISMTDVQNDRKIYKYVLNRPTHGRNYSGEQKINFESPVPFSKCLRTKLYSNMNVYFDPKGCQTLLLKESEPLLFTLGSWTRSIVRLMQPTITTSATE